MSKTLLWIDDSMELILEVIHGLIVDSWKLNEENEEGMRTRILIFGDAGLERNSEALWSLADEKEMNLKLLDLFLEKCENVEGPTSGNETAEKNWHLVDKAIQILFKKEDSAEDLNLYRAIRTKWKAESDKASSKDEKDGYEQAKQYVTQIIERMHIAQAAEAAETLGAEKAGTIIGIDLELLAGDIERTKSGERIISMELFNQLREKQYPCFIYSSHADDKQLIDAWTHTYQKLYQDENPVKTFERSNFSKKDREHMLSQIEKDVR